MYEDQLNATSTLNLLLAAAIVWNIIYMQACLKRLRADGKVVQEKDLDYLSPLFGNILASLVAIILT